MAAKIKADVLQALADWKAGKMVKSIELGHVHRMTMTEDQMASHPNARNSIDLSKRLSNDQERAHAYCFHLIELFSINGVPESHEAFRDACNDYELQFHWGETPVKDYDAFNLERDAAESLAWKALHVGWARAIAGHAPEMYIEVTNPAAVAAT